MEDSVDKPIKFKNEEEDNKEDDNIEAPPSIIQSQNEFQSQF